MDFIILAVLLALLLVKGIKLFKEELRTKENINVMSILIEVLLALLILECTFALVLYILMVFVKYFY